MYWFIEVIVCTNYLHQLIERGMCQCVNASRRRMSTEQPSKAESVDKDGHWQQPRFACRPRTTLLCDRQSWNHVCILFCHVNVPVHRNIYHSLEAVCCLQFTIACNPFLCCCSLHLERLQILHFFWELASTEVSI